MSKKRLFEHKHTMLAIIGAIGLLLAIITIVSIFHRSELIPSEGKSVIIDSTGLNSNILITRSKDSATVAFDSQLICVQAPCPEMRIEDKLDFSERGMKYLDEFLAKHENGEVIKYTELDYKDKRIIKSVTERTDENITTYSASIYGQNDELYKIEVDRDQESVIVTCKSHDCKYADGARNSEEAYDLIESLCAEAGESDTANLEYSTLNPTERDVFDGILSETAAD